MIRELRIRNLALIESLTLELSPGFSVFTGETGAGKSILIGAIGLLLGDRASADSIRTGYDDAEISGIFGIATIPHQLRALCDELSIPLDEKQLIIRRRVSRLDRSRIHVNEVPLSLASLKRLGTFLIDMHGQHEHQSLLDETNHRNFIDRLDTVRDFRQHYDDAFTAFSEISNECARHETATRQRMERREMIEFQLHELEQAHCKPGEEEELEAELKLLSSSAQRIASIQGIMEHLSASGNASLDKQLATIKRNLEQLFKLDTTVLPWIDEMDNASRIVSELEIFCSSYLELAGEQCDPARIEKINGRLAKIQRLKKKYSLSIEGLLDKITALRNDLSLIENSDADRKELEKQLASARSTCLISGKALSEARKKAAQLFDASIISLMQQLGFKDGLWRTAFEPCKDPQDYGLENIRFFVRTNPGEAELPLASTASGGEISRLMLAIKSVLASGDPVPVLIFDEIDTGIGGTVAGYVGTALQKLSTTHQVLCISHLHQIASQADRHLRVYKETIAERTVTHVRELTSDERIDEIARMLGGDSAIARQHALELLKKKGG